MRKALVLVVALAALVVLPTAAANPSFHTSQAIVHPIAGAPFAYAFVNDIHTEGVQIGARERYVLVGAEPNRRTASPSGSTWPEAARVPVRRS